MPGNAVRDNQEQKQNNTEGREERIEMMSK